MGYEYSIRGWFKSSNAVDLSALSSAGGGYDFVDCNRAEMWIRVTGADRNYALFATESKSRNNYYVSVLDALMKASGGTGLGLVTVTGEWAYDGKDRFVVAAGGRLSTVPISCLYDPLTPWNATYCWDHYMSRKLEDLTPPDSAKLQEALAGQSSIKGWIDLKDHRISEEDGNGIIAQIVNRDRRMTGGVAFLNQYMEPYLLIGQKSVHADAIVTLLAKITAEHDGAYGLLYCADETEQTQVPIALSGGNVQVLPELALAANPSIKQLPAILDAYEGLGAGFLTIALNSSLDLHLLSADVRKILGARPVEPERGWRLRTDISGPAYLFNAGGLTMILTANEGQAAGSPHPECPYLLIVYLEGEAEPKLLIHHGRQTIERLRTSGISVAQGCWPG